MFTRYLLAICLGGFAEAGTAATYWQIQQSTVTAVVEGDQDAAKATATTVLRLQAAARLLLSWPDSYEEPPVLAFVVNERLLRRIFQFPPEPPGAYSDSTARHGTWARTPSLNVVATAMGYERGREFRSLQRIYGEALVDAEPSHDWPECAHLGMVTVFAAAELTAPNQFYLAGTKVAGYEHIWNPQEMLRPSIERVPQWVTDERGYSYYLLSFMIASATKEERNAFGRMLTSVGRGTPLDTATLSELHQTLPEFTTQYREFSRAWRSSPEFHQIRADLPGPIPSMPEPAQLSSEQVQTLMKKLCSKIQNCRK
jgi:hypothetical protein